MNEDARSYTVIQPVLAARLRRGETGSVFIEDTDTLTAKYADGRIIKAASSKQVGSALRVVGANGASELFASNESQPKAICNLLQGSGERLLQTGQATDLRLQGTVQLAELDAFCSQVDQVARDYASTVTQVLIDAEIIHRTITIVTPNNLRSEERSLAYLTVRAVSVDGSDLTTGFYTPAISGPLGDLDPVEIGSTAAARAVAGLGARPAPIANLPVVVGGGRGMVLIHEACCHPLEGDEILRGSVYAERLGQTIGSDQLSIYDDPGIGGAVGSYGFDDEGIVAQRTTLVDHGILAGLLTDSSTSRALRQPSSGNARVENYKNTPIPRMSNTVVGTGEFHRDQIIANTQRGIYAEVVGGGEVIEATGEFAFRVLNGRLIENGVLGDAIEETTISGNGAEVLTKIDMVGNDVQIGAAKCGKRGQFVPVGVVGPTLRIASLRVGGTKR